MLLSLMLQAITYSLALWMGLYVLRRNWRKAAMRFIGIGLVGFAAGLAVTTLSDSAISRVGLGAVPLVMWAAAVWQLTRWDTLNDVPRRPLWLLVIGSIFLVMSVGGLLLPRHWLALPVMQLAIGVDLLLVGYAIALLDAYDEGEALLPDALQSLAVVALGDVLLGAQVMVVMAMEGRSAVLVAALFGVVAVFTLLQLFAGWLQAVLDRLVFVGRPAVQRQRAALRAETEALARQDAALELMHMDADEFTRHTRRALRDLNHPDKLMTSPLIQLPLLDERLENAQIKDRPLERAGELRGLLVERIRQLKPNDDAYGVTEAWRYYNVLYYPYVVGVKPYSRRYTADDLDEGGRVVYEWFRAQVPERTLYNWQNAAASMIAQDLQATLAVDGSVLSGAGSR